VISLYSRLPWNKSSAANATFLDLSHYSNRGVFESVVAPICGARRAVKNVVARFIGLAHNRQLYLLISPLKIRGVRGVMSKEITPLHFKGDAGGENPGLSGEERPKLHGKIKTRLTIYEAV
jgi:hypothetical protein